MLPIFGAANIARRGVDSVRTLSGNRQDTARFYLARNRRLTGSRSLIGHVAVAVRERRCHRGAGDRIPPQVLRTVDGVILPGRREPTATDVRSGSFGENW